MQAVSTAEAPSPRLKEPVLSGCEEYEGEQLPSQLLRLDLSTALDVGKVYAIVSLRGKFLAETVTIGCKSVAKLTSSISLCCGAFVQRSWPM